MKKLWILPLLMLMISSAQAQVSSERVDQVEKAVSERQEMVEAANAAVDLETKAQMHDQARQQFWETVNELYAPAPAETPAPSANALQKAVDSFFNWFR